MADLDQHHGGSNARAAVPKAAGWPVQAPFLSLCTQAVGGRTTPVLFADNPIGGAILSTPLASVAAAAVPAIGAFLPVSISGLSVSEPLHRFDAEMHAPTLDRGMTGANRIGEALGAASFRWLLAPEGFEATPSSAPPPTAMSAARSQRFVMLDGLLTVQDRRQGGLRFFGAGRTYPATLNHEPRLFFAGVAVVIEGTGSLKGVRGTLAISGEITRATALAMTIVGRFDSGSPIALDDRLGPLIDAAAGADRRAVVFTIAGEPDACGGERLAGARIGNDLPNATHLRSLVRIGPPLGSVRGPIAFDLTECRWAVPLSDMRREFTFTDPAGRPVGTLSLEALEGASLREPPDERGSVARVVAFGRVAGGTGALAGAAGVATLETVVAGSGASTSLYVVRLADPDGRFGLSFVDARTSGKRPADGTAAPPPPEEAKWDDASAASIAAGDRALLGHAERTLADGMELARWLEAKHRAGDFAERFEIVRERRRGDRSFGFFDTAVAAGAARPVMGIVQEMVCDRQRPATAEHVRVQLKEFVLRYLMRASRSWPPDAAPDGARVEPPPWPRSLSWLPDEGPHVGVGYRQRFYRLAATGAIGRFPAENERAIVDLREMGPVYDWIVLEADRFDVDLSFAPFGDDRVKLQVPVREPRYLVLGPAFVKSVENPAPDVIGQYGFGYALVPDAADPGPGGPGRARAGVAIQTVDFAVMGNGEIRARATRVVSRPDRIASFDIDPVDWTLQIADLLTAGLASRALSPVRAAADRLPLRLAGVDPIAAYIRVANAVTGGAAARRYGISKPVLEKRMLVQHYMQQSEMLIDALLVWRTVPDWTDHERLPDSCRDGAVG